MPFPRPAIKAPRLVMRAPRLVAVAVVFVTAIITVGAGTLAWGSTLRPTNRLLQGITIASVDVSGATGEEALAAVEAHLASGLDQVVKVTHEEDRWEITARRLRATTDAGQVVAEALERSAAVGLLDLARMRLSGGSAGLEFDVTVRLPDHEIDAFIGTIAETAPPATLRWPGRPAASS